LIEEVDMGWERGLSQIAASLVTSKFKAPNELEFEKVYMPYILYSKKRYAGQMYTRPDKPDKIDIKGLQVKTLTRKFFLFLRYVS
jgi:DNA polymerase delta subunit 1